MPSNSNNLPSLEAALQAMMIAIDNLKKSETNTTAFAALMITIHVKEIIYKNVVNTKNFTDQFGVISYKEFNRICETRCPYLKLISTYGNKLKHADENLKETIFREVDWEDDDWWNSSGKKRIMIQIPGSDDGERSISALIIETGEFWVNFCANPAIVFLN